MLSRHGRLGGAAIAIALLQLGCSMPSPVSVGGQGRPSTPEDEAYALLSTPGQAFKVGDPLPGLNAQQRATFNRGLALFVRDDAKAFKDFGPIFNDVTCVACHGNGGPGGPGETKEYHMAAMAGPIDENKLANLDTSYNFLDGSKVPPHGTTPINVGGDHMQFKALPGLLLEHAVDTRHELKGTGLHGVISLRETFTVMGDGLITAIPDQAIKDRAAQNRQPWSNAHRLGIGGRWSPTNLGAPPGVIRVGRFGTKAKDFVTIAFNIGAYKDENNLPSTIVPVKQQANGPAKPSPVEVSVPDLQDVAVYQDLLAPPLPTRSAPRGQWVFTKAGCIECHWTGYRTAGNQAQWNALVAAGSTELTGLENVLMNKPVPAYSDFLLHKMGGGKVVRFIDPRPEVQRRFQTDAVVGVGVGPNGLWGLADGAQGLGLKDGSPFDPDPAHRPATGLELRTTMLWGLHLHKTYLHDGRATTLDQAIQAHYYRSDDPRVPDSEANEVVSNYNGRGRDRTRNLSSDERTALLEFLNTL